MSNQIKNRFMKKSEIAKRLYQNQFKNEIIGATGSKESIYNILCEYYFPYVDMKIKETDDVNTDEVTFDFYELGYIKFRFCFKSITNSVKCNILRLADVQHISTNVLENVVNTDKIKEQIIEKMFRRRILYTVCMKRMIQNIIENRIFPYADVTMTEQTDGLTKVSFKFGEFKPLSFDFKFEPRNGLNYRLSKIY